MLELRSGTADDVKRGVEGVPWKFG
jgi:hypothetical protein